MSIHGKQINFMIWISCNIRKISIEALHLRLYSVMVLFVLLAGCMSPYGPTYLPDIRGLSWTLVDDNEANIQIDETLSLQGDCRRDALLITAAKIALQYNFSHFDFVKNPNSVKGDLSNIANAKDTNISVFLCRGVCPTMYSADSLAHMLARRFTSTDSAETMEKLTNKCI